MALLENDVKRLMIATSDADTGNRLADAISAGQEMAALTSHIVVGAITATNVSQTVDFGVLKVGDLVVMIPATAGSADFIGPVATAGTLGQAAVVGNLYLVLRARVAPTTSNIKF
jgi:hypothetical protein